MAIEFKAGAVETEDGGRCWLKPMDPDGSDLSTPGSFFEIGFIADTSLMDKPSVTRIKDETGKTVKKKDGDREPTMTLLLMQSDKDTLDFLKDGCRGKYYQIIKYNGIIDNKHQYTIMPICEISPGIELKTGVKNPPMEISILNNNTAIVVSSFPTGCNLVASQTVAIGQMYAIAEVAVA